jgi:ribosomal protein L40E
MTDTAGKFSLKDEFSALSTKQMIAIIVAIAVALVLELFGASTACLTMLVVPIVIYMVPHLMGVESVKVKAVVGALFFTIALILGTFAYSGSDEATDISKDPSNDYIYGVSYSAENDNLSATVVFDDPDVPNWKVLLTYGTVSAVGFGVIRGYDDPHEATMIKAGETNRYYYDLFDLKDGKLYLVLIQIVDADDEDKVYKNLGFTINTGFNDYIKVSFFGAAPIVLLGAVVFSLLLGLSYFMRRGLQKTRDKMEEQGRLYPQGYGRCKECGALVLPGEVTCKKCGAYIDVPEDIKANKKDYFICSECGAEVPNDSNECPKCGAKFDGVETEVVHADGSVDVSTETFECSECGAQVPANASHCPNCGAKFDEDDE